MLANTALRLDDPARLPLTPVLAVPLALALTNASVLVPDEQLRGWASSELSRPSASDLRVLVAGWQPPNN